MNTNVLGTPLETCSIDPITGFTREGSCATSDEDRGRHVICTQVTEEFLLFSKEQGNDLTTPVPLADFPGLQPGDRWCVCAERWKEALENDVAPPVILTSTDSSALEVVSLEDLLTHSYHNGHC
jgi:uncharacterized protein (DUF2237 family)